MNERIITDFFFFLYKNKNGECLERSIEGVTCFIVDLTTFYLNFNTEVIQFLVPNIIMYLFTRMSSQTPLYSFGF